MDTLIPLIDGIRTLLSMVGAIVSVLIGVLVARVVWEVTK